MPLLHSRSYRRFRPVIRPVFLLALLVFTLYNGLHNHKYLRSIPSPHYAGPGALLKVFLPVILPKHLEEIIVMDTDTIFNENILELWQRFELFNNSQVFGAAYEQLSCGKEDHVFSYHGINGGVQMYHLCHMDKKLWKRLVIQALTTEVRENGHLNVGEQTIINRMIEENPHLYHRLPCEWNVQVYNPNGYQCCPVVWPRRSMGEIDCHSSNTAKPSSVSLKLLKLIHFNKPGKPGNGEYVDDAPSDLFRIARSLNQSTSQKVLTFVMDDIHPQGNADEEVFFENRIILGFSHLKQAIERHAFFIIVLALAFVMLVLDVTLCVLSSRGGIMEVTKRSNVPAILMIIFVLSLLEIPIHCANIYFSTTYLSSCNRSVVIAFIAGNGLRLFTLLQYFICLMLHFRKSGAFWRRIVNKDKPRAAGLSIHDDASSTTHREACQVMHQSVRRRLKRFQLLKRARRHKASLEDEEDEQLAIDSAAALFSQVFYDVNLVVSDIVAGLLLLRWQTEQWVGSGHIVPFGLVERDSTPCDFVPWNGSWEVGAPVSTTQPYGDVIMPPPSTTEHDSVAFSGWLSIQRLQRVAQIATSLYGHLFYIYSMQMSPNSMCGLYRHLSCVGCRDKTGSVDQIEIGCCLCAGNNCDLAAVLEVSGFELSDLISVNFANTVYQSPYIVATDDRTQCIVIGVRGTLSLEDAVVDLLYDGVRLTEIENLVESQTGHRPLFVGHRGMVASARKLYQRLFEDRGIELARIRRPNYPLVVCGHSLGAGIASFLTLLLRPRFPEVRGYALSSPLGMMNSELAEFAKPFLVSIVYGFDGFARLNRATMMDFKWRLLDALNACPVPKHRLLSRGASLCVSQCCRKLFRSPCCTGYCCMDTPTIGADATQFDAVLQTRLINPYSTAEASGEAIDAVTQLHSVLPPSSRGDDYVEAVSSSNGPQRMLPETRSLLRWMRSDNICLLGSSKTDKKMVKRSVVPPTSSSSNNTTVRQQYKHYKGDSSQLDEADDDPNVIYDMNSGMFGGRVLHIVDVSVPTGQDLMQSVAVAEEEEPQRLSSPLPNAEHSPTSAKSDSSRAFLTLSGQTNAITRSSPDSGKTTTVAVWSSAEQFQTLLIHPRMFRDHMPNLLLDALNRIHAQLTPSETGTPSKIPRSHVFRRLR